MTSFDDRREIERKLTRAVCSALLASPDIAALRIEGSNERPRTDVDLAVDDCMQQDDCQITTIPSAAATDKAAKRRGVLLVYGNCGWDLIAAYSMSLEDVLAPVNAMADAIGGAL